jgi:PAS domain S-box-containing protein
MAYRCRYKENLAAVYLSEGVLELTGYRPEAFTSGQVHFRDLIHPSDLQRVRAATRDGLKSHEDVEVEYRIKPHTGPEKWVLSRGRGVYDDQRQLLFFEGLAIDITARKQAEADKLTIERKLLESQKLESLGLLAGGIAHDFNNLLTGIMGHANLARFHPLVDAEVIEHLSKIESGAVRAAELCQQMLAYSGRSNFIVEAVDLNLLIRDTLPLLQGSLSSRARLELTLDVQPMVVMADATQLRQILMNLILNAADALGATGGEITVTTGCREFGREFLAAAHGADTVSPGKYVFMEVRDTGCGMTRDTISKIFDPFFTTKFTGRGLGLAAVLGIVRGHAGALRVCSEVNRGSTFTLILPPSNEAISHREILDTTAPWRSTGRVLVIDDEEPVRNVAAALLETFGFTVVTASSGADGIECFRESAFDLVLLDLTMPGMNGEETLARLRAISSRVRVLLFSGYSESDRIAQLAASGPLLFLQKPFTRSSLEQKLQEILEHQIDAV